jgi:hypothetical protein
MPKTVTVQGKKIVLGKAYPVMIKKVADDVKRAEIRVNTYEKSLDGARMSIERRFGAAVGALRKLREDTKVSVEQMGYLKDLDGRDLDSVASWYAAAEKAKTEAERKKNIAEAEKLMAAQEKRAHELYGQILERNQQIDKFVAAFEAAERDLQKWLDKVL